MLYTIAPVGKDILLEYLTLLGSDTITERTRIGKRDLLIPLLLTHRLLLFEGVYTAHRDVQRGQCERECRVAHILRDVKRAGEVELLLGEAT